MNGSIVNMCLTLFFLNTLFLYTFASINSHDLNKICMFAY